MAAGIVCDEPRTCAMCGCTESMACIERDGLGCSWVRTKPDVCSACERAFAMLGVMKLSEVDKGDLPERLARACREHRERAYGNG